MLFWSMWLACAVGIEIPWVADADDNVDDGQPLVPSLDWEALIQSSGSSEKLKVLGDVGVDSDFRLGGTAFLNGMLNTEGKATFKNDVEVHGDLNHGGQQFVLGKLDNKKQLNKHANRALYHHSEPIDSLYLNFDGDFEGGVVVGGPETLIQGTLVSKGQITAETNLEVQGSTVVVGTKDGKPQGSNAKNRAIAHGDNDMLLLNEEGDFEGGVHLQGKGLFADGKIAIGKGHTNPEADIHMKTDTEATIMFSHAVKDKNSVFIKGVGGSGAAMDMEIGSTSESGGLKVNFKGDVSFLGDGLTHFKRGDTVFASGNVGVGANTAGGKHGITVDTTAKSGHLSNDLALTKGSMHFFGGLYDTSTDGNWHLDLDKGGHVKAINVASSIGIGTENPISQYGDTNAALIHMVDSGRPVLTLESQKDDGHSTVVMKTGDPQNGGSEWVLDQSGTTLKMSSDSKDMLVLDNVGKIGIGRVNNEPYGVNLHIGEGDNNPLNDLAIPHGHLHLKGKIYDTFDGDGGDKFYLDPSSMSNLKHVHLEGKLSYEGVAQPSLYHLELPNGDAHLALGRSLFLNGFGEESARVTNNAVVDSKGKWSLPDAAKLASAIELRNTGQIEMFATKQAGKTDWVPLLGMDGIKGAVYAHGKFGVGGMVDPKHTFHMPGDEHTMSLGNNLFLAGAGSINRITANAYMKHGQWVIEKSDAFASSIELKTSGGIDMYGTESAGAVQWKKMFGFDAPANKVYAFGKFGIGMEDPTHTLTIPSGEHHVSLGDKLFLNGGGDVSRILGNAFMKLGKINVHNKGLKAVSVELDNEQGQLRFGGTQSRGSNDFLHLLSVDFTNKAVSVLSGRLGIRTASPKASVDVRGHVYLQDPSNAGVIYTSSVGSGLYFRSAENPGTFASSQERFFFGNNHRAGFGTVQPQAHLHIVHATDVAIPHLKLETPGTKTADGNAAVALEFDIKGSSEGLTFETKTEGQYFNFKSGDAEPLSILGHKGEATENNVNFAKSTVLLVPDGGRAAIGGAPKGQHNLQLTGTGMMITGNKHANTGTLAFANDGGGSGFQLDYANGIMQFASLPPMTHLKTTRASKIHMAVLDNGRIGVGTTTPSSALSVKSDDGITVENTAGDKWTYKTAEDGGLEFVSNKGGFFKVGNAGGMQLSRKHSGFKLEVDGTGIRLNGDEHNKENKAPLVFNADGGGKGFRMDYYKEKMMLGHGDGSKWHMTVLDNGLIGVGTPVPEHAMHVKHDSGIAIEHGTKKEKWMIATTEAGKLSFFNKGSPKIAFTNAGWVGIGTDKPTKTLHVEGDVYVSGKMHVDNDYLKKHAAAVAAATPVPMLEHLESSEALIQLDEHVSAKMEDDSYAAVHRQDTERAAEPVDYASLLAVMHRVVQDHQTEIKKLNARVEALEGKK